MEGIGGEGASGASPVAQWGHDAWRMYQYYLDKTTPHTVYRWIGTLAVVIIYCLRVYYVQGFYIVAYGLGIYLLNLLIGFLSPLVDPELQPSSDGPLLPTKGSDEFKPFIRRLPEFKFWCPTEYWQKCLFEFGCPILIFGRNYLDCHNCHGYSSQKDYKLKIGKGKPGAYIFVKLIHESSPNITALLIQVTGRIQHTYVPGMAVLPVGGHYPPFDGFYFDCLFSCTIWYSFTKAFCIAFFMTFFSMFDVPVFWPILLCYWIVLFILTMRRQIAHMIKYKYIPLSIGKQRYGKKPAASSSGFRGD